jgi:hypothetical protein
VVDSFGSVKKSGDFYYVDVPANQLYGWIASKDVAAIEPN